MLGSIGGSLVGARERTGKAPCGRALRWGWRLCLCRREWRSSGAGPERARGVGRAEHGSGSVPAHAGRCQGKTTDVKDTGWGCAAAPARAGPRGQHQAVPAASHEEFPGSGGGAQKKPFLGQCCVTLVLLTTC